MGSIEGPEFFTTLRPVILIVQFHDLARLDGHRNDGGVMNFCGDQAIPTLHRDEARAVFTYTKFLKSHQLHMSIKAIEIEVLFQIEETWGVVFSPEDLKLTIFDPVRYQNRLPEEMTIREALDLFRPHWHHSQELGLGILRPFEHLSHPYILRIQCLSVCRSLGYYEHRGASP